MKITAMVAMAALAGTWAQAGENGQAIEPRVTVCMDAGITMEALQAQAIATKMFAGINVKLDWHTERACPANREGIIHIRLEAGSPAGSVPGPLAWALPYEGVHIQVFVDRVRKLVTPKIVPVLMAHVLVHEITHILQGVSRHSECGIMKATWDHKDHLKMAWRPLSFTEKDVELIHLGLEKRAAHLAPVGQPTADSSPAVVAAQQN
jgi:hypothetical protein